MDIQQGKNDSLRAYHGRYNNLLLNIPMVNDKVAYMAFFKGLRYGKLKKALLVRMPLTKDELTVPVTTHIKLEELKVGADQPPDLREIVLKKDGNMSPKKPPVSERIQRDKGQFAWKPYKGDQEVLTIHERTRKQRKLGEVTSCRTHRYYSRGNSWRGDSRNSMKKYVRRDVYGAIDTQVYTDTITFTNADCQGLEMPHDDPLFIAPKIDHYIVERIGNRRNTWRSETGTRMLSGVCTTTTPKRNESGVKAQKER
ncbi:hypothetical protein LIER_36189 [Lithospermum erythrorhizon]|uniref:Reverse transcriptase domain-containing protein n=1 Tax=Lithospermum erythrorhizon TaxID=34254 RepID=A0AAV3P276_LITER